MTRITGFLVLALAASLAAPLRALRAQEGGRGASEPFKRASQEALDFRGAGREEPEPAVGEVVLGWFGPGDPNHPEFGAFWRGAAQALEEENAAGGYRGKPFRLEPAWSESPWKAGIVEVTRLVYDRGAWAVIGGIDGATTHLALQIALKSHFLLLSPGSTDATADHANVPWLFSLPPSDEEVSPKLADGIAVASDGGSFAIAVATDHDSRAALGALRRALGGRGLAPAALVEVESVDPDLRAVGARLLQSRPRAVVVVAPSRLAGRLAEELRRTGFAGALLGGSTLSRAAFATAAGPAAEGVVAPRLARGGPAAGPFVAAYEARWGEAPDDGAAFGYDAVRLVAAAVRRAGLNRPRIRDALRALEPWPGVGGVVRWSAVGRSQGGVRLVRWSGGRLQAID